MVNWLLDRVWRPLREAAAAWSDDDAALMSAAVSYYAALSLFPLLLVLTSGLGFAFEFTGWGENAQKEIISFIERQSSARMAEQVREMLSDVKTGALVSGPLGVVSLLLAALAMFMQFDRAFDRIWNVEPPEGGGVIAKVKRLIFLRLKALLMLIGVGVGILATFVAGMVFSTVTAATSEALPAPDRVWEWAQTGVIIVLNGAMLTILYRTLPKAPVGWREAMIGGLLAAAVWEVGRQVLAAFVIGQKFGAYGLIGSFIAIMLWIYYAAAVLFFGAEYVQVLCTRCDEKESPAAATTTSNAPSPGAA